MSLKLINLVIIFVITFAWELSFVISTTCPANEEFKECGDVCNINCGENTEICVFSCGEPGCYCKTGFQRLDGKCVEKAECFKCPRNEYYTTCGNECTDKCNGDPNLCPTDCGRGCFCITGYKRNTAGECVPQEQCCCDPNEEFKMGNECADKCGATSCTKELTKGCFCKTGYKRDPKTERCIPECQCPKGNIYCEYTEEYKCSNTCKDLIDFYGFRQFCSDDCYYGCFCKTGYARDPNNNKCVPEPSCTNNNGYYYS